MDDLKSGALYIGTIPSSMDNNRCSVTLEDDGSVTFYIYAPNANKVEVEESIKKLPEDLQEVVILHYFQDLKLKEVADIIGIGLPLVKYRIGKAKELLSVYLGDKK